MKYICKIASLEEIEKRMNYLVETHPNNLVWVQAKENAIRGFHNQSKIMYVGILNGEIVCEASACIQPSAFIGDIENTENLLSETRAYLSGFRTNKQFEGKGYFSKLYTFMEQDLKSRGYTELCLGVEPCEVKNMQIYFHLGFVNYIKTTIEHLPAKDKKSKPKEEIVNFYYKALK